MKKIKKILLTSLGFGLVAAVLGLLNSRPAPAQFPPPVIPVRVTNTPLPVQGSVSASISNTVPVSGTVNANVTSIVPVSGTVAVSSLPPVALGSTITVPVQDVDNPARRPVFGSCDLITVPTGGIPSCNINFTGPGGNFTSVPAGNRLVIDFVSGELELPSGSIPIEFNIRTSLGNGYTDISMDPRFVGTGVIPGPDLWKVSEETHIYEDPGDNVVMEVQTTAPPGLTFSAVVTVTGHLVTIP